ncbi:hypothetical protein PAMA_003857 [Pampus argenteus]
MASLWNLKHRHGPERSSWGKSEYQQPFSEGEEIVGKSKREKRAKGLEGKPPAEERGALGPEEMKDRGFDNFLQSPSESAQRLLPQAHYSEPGAQQWADPKSHRLSPSTEERSTISPGLGLITSQCLTKHRPVDERGGSTGRMQSRDANFIICSEGWWQMALRGACDTGVSEPAGDHMKDGLCRAVRPAGVNEDVMK